MNRSTIRRLPTLADVAAQAGVSIATTDRVLNNRASVRPATLARVMRAATELGYLADGAPAATPAAAMRITFLLPEGPNRFLNDLGRLVAEKADDLLAMGARCHVAQVASFDAKSLARSLLECGRKADGVVLMGVEHPDVRDAVNLLAARGTPCVTLISDVAHSRRIGYVGLDNRSAGRTAAWLLSRFLRPRPAKVALIAGSLSYRAHEEREMGFLSLIKESEPTIEVVGLREGYDDDAQCYRAIRAILARHPDLAGIYNIGSGSQGVGRAMTEVKGGRDIVFIGHGLTPDTRALLREGLMDAVITHNPMAAIIDCVTALKRVRDGAGPLDIEPARCEVMLRENLPAR
ncbi:LacI family DNA-binding transcriptional regulator [Xanthobacteraceae bacterium A53D]